MVLDMLQIRRSAFTKKGDDGCVALRKMAIDTVGLEVGGENTETLKILRVLPNA